MSRHTPRGAGWERIRRQVFALMGDRCWLCGHPGATEIDHIVAVSRGGTNDLSNLAPAHKACNIAKGAGPGRRTRPKNPQNW